MASRLLLRLRHALASEGSAEAATGPEAEQFPESSELEDDDAEGLSSRLSGTLSFTSAEDEEDEDDEDDEVAGPNPLPLGDRASGEDAGECGGRRRGPELPWASASAAPRTGGAEWILPSSAVSTLLQCPSPSFPSASSGGNRPISRLLGHPV